MTVFRLVPGPTLPPVHASGDVASLGYAATRLGTLAADAEFWLPTGTGKDHAGA
ncbi:hypothetical protein SAMN05444340_1236 [Citreimonas salinaria]|uniref:Uncharacterized protein n=1 Tax=Citreimonas salinaria TaxID=321339 RepID=A0A1H3NEA5_9RHOB|nr:hypothetical protein SAMN05444340_1236 [Citreimonas salinaria]